jgi:threonine synthase
MINPRSEDHGTAVAVSEASILGAFRDCGRVGVPVSYESAATLAALRDLRARGVIKAGATVLLLMTASHFIPLGHG